LGNIPIPYISGTWRSLNILCCPSGNGDTFTPGRAYTSCSSSQALGSLAHCLQNWSSCRRSKHGTASFPHAVGHIILWRNPPCRNNQRTTFNFERPRAYARMSVLEVGTSCYDVRDPSSVAILRRMDGQRSAGPSQCPRSSETPALRCVSETAQRAVPTSRRKHSTLNLKLPVQPKSNRVDKQ